MTRPDERGESGGMARPDFSAVPRRSLGLLGLVAALRALGLVLIADGIAQGIVAVQGRDLDAVTFAAVVGICGALLRGGAEWTPAVLARRVAIGVKLRLRRDLWRRIAAGLPAKPATPTAESPPPIADVDDSAAAPSGAGSAAVLASDGLDDLDNYFTQAIPAMIAAAVIPLLVGLRILGADWVSAGVIVVTVPLIPLFMILIGRHTQQRTNAALSALARLADHLAELARGLPVLVGLNRVDDQERALDAIQREYRQRTAVTLRWAFLSGLALELLATISVALVAVLLGIRLMNGTMELAPALVALILAPECFAAFREMGAAFHASQDGLGALARVRTLLAIPRARDLRVLAGSGALVIDGLCVQYAGRREPTVAGLSARITDITAIEGASGAGKSTVFAAITGTLPADAVVSGEITTPRVIGWSPQSPRAFAATVREELALVNPARTDGAEIDAVGVDSTGVVTAGADGAEIDTVLAELGLTAVADRQFAELSPGEQRRVSVARALLRVDAARPGAVRASVTQARLTKTSNRASGRPADCLLILDEPTAHLDAAAADLVRAAIVRRAAYCVVVLASHDSATLALASHTITVSGGDPTPIVEPGGALAEPESRCRDGALEREYSRNPSVPRRGEVRISACGISTQPRSSAGSIIGGGGDPIPGGVSGGDPTPIVEPGGALAEPESRRRDGALERRHSGNPSAPRSGDGRVSAGGSSKPWASWIGGTLLGVLATLLALSLTAVSGWLIVRASVEEYIAALMVAIVGVRGFGIGRSVGRYAERLITHRAAFETVDELRLRLWRAIAAQGAGSRRLLGGGTPLDYLITLAHDLRDQLPRVVVPLTSGIAAYAAAIVTTAFVLPDSLALVAAWLTATMLVAVAVQVAAARRSEYLRVSARSAITRQSAALAEAADDLRGNGSTDAALAVLDTHAQELAAAERRNARGLAAGTAIVAASLAGLATTIALLSFNSGIAAERVSVIALLALALIEPLGATTAAAQRWVALRHIQRRLSVVLDATTTTTGSPAPTAATTTTTTTTSNDGAPTEAVSFLELDDVSVTYPRCAAPAVSNVTAAVRRGEWLAIDGPSGSGKSTLLSAIMGALPLSNGSISANHRPVSDLPAHEWRSRVAWCPQEAYSFDSTIRGNLLLARGASESELIDALHQAGLGRLLSELPDGLDTRVGPGGSRLSGGERQRLAVARALLTGADVVLLDEPTAHLDAPTAETLIADLREATRNRVVVLVSHRRDDRKTDDRLVSLG